MYAFQSDMSNSSASSILLKAKRFGIFSVFAITTNIFIIPQAAYSQIAVDGSTATEVKGNVISPTGSGTVNGGNLYNSFQEFNVPTSGVIFNTGNSSVDGSKINNLINRVTGENPSSILGTIESRQAFPNANLYLLNPNGVIFSPNARLDIGGSFNVSTGTGLGFDQNQKFTVDKNSLSFPSGDPKNIQFAISKPAGIINQGNLSVDAGKNIAITAGTVINTGNLTAPNGNVSLAAVTGNSLVELRSPDLVLGLSVSKDVIPNNWNGAIASLPKLAESLTGKASEANQVVVKPDGSISLVTNPSSSDIAVKEGMAIASGIINVSSESTRGGNVGIFGNQVGLVNAQVNASGATGGGTVLIGGDFQGKGVAPQAEFTNLDKNSQIQADAISGGDGGRVAIWSTDTTNVEAAITAKGGLQFGNGGFIETSGKKFLSIISTPNASANNGIAGTWLIDPTNITIIPTSGTLGTNIIGANLINAVLNSGTSVIIDTNTTSGTPGVGDIFQNIGADIIKTSGGDVTLTFNANNDIFLNGNITSSSNKLNLVLNANSDNVDFGRVEILQSISTLGGNITINGDANGAITNFINGVVTNGSLNSGGGNINITGTSNIQSGVSINNGINSGGGSITINSTNTALNTGVGAVIDGVVTSQNGNISITANKPLNTDQGLFVFGSIDAGTGSLTLTSDGIAFAGGENTISGTGNFLLQPLNANRSIKLGGIFTANVLDINNTNFGAIQQNFNSITIGRLDSNAAINLASDVAFDSSLTIQSPAGLGSINTSGFGLTNTGGSITLFANQNITTGSITATGNAIAITSTSGAINTSAGNLDSAITTGNGGAITLTALGNITAGNIFSSTSNGNGGDISIVSTGTNGAITVNGVLDSFSTTNGTGGDILLQAAGNITTNDLIISAASNGNGGNISYISSGGSIIATQRVRSSSAGTTLANGNGGDILFQAAGDIITSDIISEATSLGSGGDVTVITSGGNITTNGSVDSSASIVTVNGDGGNVRLEARGNVIVTGNITPSARFGVSTAGSLKITSSAGSLNLQNLANTSSVELFAEQDIITRDVRANGSGNITITSNAGSIDTSLGTVSTDADFNSGEITFSALGNITVGRIDSNSTFSKPGSISLTPINGSILLNGDISTSSLFGGDTDINNVGNINLTGNVSLLAPIRLDVEDDDIGGNINLANATITGNQDLFLALGSGTANLGAIGTSAAPLNSLIVFSPPNIGNTVLNNDIFTVGSLTFDTPVTLANNVAITTSGSAINFNSTINGTQALSLDAGIGSVILGGAVGNINPLASLTVNSQLDSSSDINIRALGNISTNAIGIINPAVNVDIQTTGSFTPNGNLIRSNSLNLSANQGINNLGNIFSSGNITIASSLGNISASLDSGISTFASNPFLGSGNISITALSGFLNLQSLSTSLFGEDTSKAGDITLTVTGNNNISVRDINTSTTGNTTGNAGTVTFVMGDGTINLIGNSINIGSENGGGSNLIVNNPLVVNSPTFAIEETIITGFGINSSGGAGSGNIVFNSTFTSPNVSDVTINNNSGNVTFNRAIASSGQPLGNLIVNSSGTTTFASTVFANSISSDFGGNTIINADLVATGANGFINLGNFTANGTISLVGNEIDLNGIASGTGDLTLKPLAVSLPIAIGSTGDLGTGTLDILNSDLNAFVNGTFNSLTIGNLNGSGAISLQGDVSFFQPTTIQSPVGSAFFSSNGFNITGVGRLGIEVGDFITINNSSFAPSVGNTLNVRLNADRDASGSGTITLFNSTINTGGQNITLGGGLNPVIAPAISTGNNAGVTIDGSTLNAEGGNIVINGTKLSTFALAINNNGIAIFGDGQASQLLTSGAGTITLVGTSSTIGPSSNVGILVDEGSLIQSANGNISIQGTGGNGSGANDIGIAIANGVIVRSTGTGNISFIGDTGNNVTSNQDISIVNGTIETLGTGNISLASAPTFSQTIRLTNSFINPTLVGGSGSIIIQSNGIDLLGTTQIRGTGNLFLQPSSSTFGITLGGSVGDSNLNLFSSELATLQDGFSQILIGRDNTSSSIILASDVIFNDSVTLRSQGVGGSINTSGFNFTSTGAINFLANQNITTGNVTALGNNLTLSSSLGAINTSQGLLNTSSTTGNGGDISLLSPSINTNLGSINTSSTVGNAGNLSFANIANGLITIAGSDINLSSGSGFAGSLNFLAPVVISNPSLTINTSSSLGTSGAVTFSNSLNGAIANANSLTVNAGNGNVTFNAIGNNTALGNLIVNTTGFTNFNSAIRASSLNTNVGGTTTINSDISTNGSQIYNDAVSLAGNAVLSTLNNDITFNGTVNGNQALTLNAGSGNITFGGTVGLISTVGNIIANSSALTTFNGVVNAGEVTTDLGGVTNVNANITTVGTQTYDDDVNLSAATIFTANNAAIAFNGNINGNQAIRVVSGSGDINFRGTVNADNLIAESSSITRFNTVNAIGIFTDELGTTELNSNITATGSVVFNDAVNLLSAVQLNTSAIAFNNNVSGNQNLTINSGANSITFGGTTTVNNLTANSTGTTRFNTVNAASLLTNAGGITELNGNITTSGAVTFNDAVNLLSAIQLNTSGAIAFNNNVNGNQNLTINSGANNITFGGTATVNNLITNSTGTTRFNTVNAGSILTNAGGITELNGNITTTGAVTFNDAVNLLSTVQFNTGGAIAFNNNLTGNQDLTLNNGANNITFGGTTTVNNLTANSTGTTRFNTVNATSLLTNAGGITELNGNITTVGTQNFGDAVALTNATQLNTTNSAITFSNTINGNQNLTVNAGSGNITFDNSLGATTALNNVTLNSTGTTRLNGNVNSATLATNAGGITQLGSNITTTGTQTYNDAVNLFATTQINTTNSAVLFNNTVDGTQDLTVNSGSGNITFNGAVGSSSPLNNLIANSTGTTRFNSSVNAASLLTNAGGTTELNGNVTTTGAVTFNDAVNLLNAVQFNTGGAITFNNNLTGNQDLTLNNGANNITFGGTTTVNNLVANSTGITRFNTVNATSLLTNAGGTTELNGTINTLGAQTYNDAVALTGDVQLNATNNAVLFNTTVDGTQNLTVNTGSGNITFNGAVSSSAILNNLITNSTGVTRFNSSVNTASLLTNAGGTTELNGNVTTTGAVTFNDAVNLLSAIQFNTGGAIAFNNNVNGNQDLTLNSGANNITFGGTTTVNNLIANSTGTTRFNTVNAASLLTNAGGTTELNGNVATTGAVTFNDAVNLLAAIQFNTGGVIAFNNNVSGNQDLTLNSGTNNITFGGTTTVNNLTANSTGTTRFNTVNAASLLTNAGGTTELSGNITTSGAVTFNDAVNLLNAIQFNTGGAIAFNNNVSGNQDLTLNSGANNITFGGTATVNNLIANSTGTTRFNTVNAGTLITNAGGVTELNGNISTTGVVTFNDAVSLLSAIQFNTGGEIAFNNNLNGNQNLTINNGANNITFGGMTTVNNLIANSTGTTRFNTVNAASLLTNAGGTTELNGNVTTTGAVTFNDAVNLLAAIQFNTGGAIAFNNTVSGNQDLTLNSGANNITFGGTTTVNNLVANSTGITRFNTVNAASLLTNVGGTTELTGNVNTTGTVTFNDAVSLLSAIQVDTGGAIAFNNIVTGNQDLTINSGANNITFGGTVTVNNLTANSTGITRVNRVNANNVVITGGTTELSGNIFSNDSVTFNNPVNLVSTVQINAPNSAIAFNNTVNGNQDLFLTNGSGDITFGSTVNLNNLFVNSTGNTRFNNSVNATSITTDFGGNTFLLGNVTTLGNQTYNDNLLIGANTTLDSSAGNGTLSFVRIQNAIAGTPSNLILNAGTGNIFFNNSVGSLSDRLGDITIQNVNEFISSGIIANSLTQNAGTGETQFGNDNEFTGNLNITSQSFSLTEAANLRVGNANIQTVNGVDLSVATNFSLLGAGVINIDSDSNSDGTGTFLNRGIITDNGFGGVVNIRTANPDIRGAVIASQISLDPSVANTSIAIGSAANGNFKLQDVALGFLQAGLVTIQANGSPVSIGSNNAFFPTGTSLEIGTASSPATSISAIAGFNLNVDRNLSLTGNTIQLGNTTVGGDLALRFTDSVSQVGVISVLGETNFVVDSNPLTNILLADFANNFGKQISFTFINLPDDDFQNLEIRDIAENATFAFFPNQVNNLKLILDNGTINLPSIPLTGFLTLQARDVNLDGDISATTASLSGDNININSKLTTTNGDLTIFNTNTLFLNIGGQLEVAGNFEQSGGGIVAIGGDVIGAGNVQFEQAINLINDINITSNGNALFNNGVTGLFALTIDTNGNSVVAKNGIGTINPLQSLTIAPSSILTSDLNSSSGVSNLDIITVGDVSLGNVINNGGDVNIQSASGAIAVGNLDRSFNSAIGNAGNIILSAEKDVSAGNINSSSFGNGGAVSIESRTAKISTGDVNTSGFSGGDVFFNASTAIDAGQINTTGNGGDGGNVILDPTGDVVVASINTSGLRGGNVTLVSTGANLRITDVLTSASSNCIGASICTSGNSSSGTISLQTGGINPFVVGDASINGSKGFLTTGISTLNLGTAIPVLLNNTFAQGGISITPGGFVLVNDPNNSFEPPQRPEVLITDDQIDTRILSVRDVFIGEADRYLQAGNLAKAFEVIEQAYISQLEIFTGKSVDAEPITIENTQDILSSVVQQTGDVAALIYPVLLKNRIEILVIPPKEKGKPFSAFTVAANQDSIETLVNEYRNNLRDVGSNDYLEQSQNLYDWVIRPIEKRLEEMKINTLVFVMDGGLRVTPPAALHDGKQFLIERYAIANIPSLRVTRIEERDRKTTRVLAMGLTESVEGFSALPSVDIEIKTISSEVLNGVSFLNKDFTVNNLQNQRQGGTFNILHLGTHAKFVSDTSKDSFIQFWDSRLKLNEIPQLRFDNPAIDMLALSACQTAVGNNLGISGLAVESGAKSVLASLWEVSDAGTAPLMISFYKAFPDAVNKAQAMRTAQLALLGGKVKIGDSQILGIEGFPSIPLPAGLSDIDLSHPFYWSSFILVGNWL